jgi:LysM repeat protein
MSLERIRLSRRQLLQSATLASLGTLLPDLPLRLPRAFAAPQSESLAANSSHLSHLAWVWQFSFDGPARKIRDVLAAHNLGVILKTHDGTSWMARYDQSPDAVSGPSRIAELRTLFENGGVPFHTWAVVRGRDPEQEAAMAADVLEAGARSMTLDLEPFPGFWTGTPQDGVAFGRALRRRQPDAYISTAFDPRPWVLQRVPLKEFAAFSDELSPMVYWDEYNSRPNRDLFALRGMRVEDISAQFLMSLAASVARSYRLPMQPVGQGTSLEGWTRFVDQAPGQVSVWRFGVAPEGVWSLLRDNPPQPQWYEVQPGDTLGTLAREWRTTVSAIADANDITNPNLIQVGQRLMIPRGATIPAATPASTAGATAAARPPTGSYVVQPGDSLSTLAHRWNASMDRIIDLNGIRNPDLIFTGLRLTIP